MIAAIYSRKSNLQEKGATGNSESVERQIAHAKAFAASKGWTVLDQHVFHDDAVSGAVPARMRPGSGRMLAAITEAKRPPFDVLIVSDQDRLGRNMTDTLVTVGEILESGVSIWAYLDGQQIGGDDAIDELTVAIRGFGGHYERQRISLRTRDAHARKIMQGGVGGGRVYGYKNVRDGDHVVREIDEKQAIVVRRIFQEVASGTAMKRICHGLMADKIAPPARKNSKGWSTGALRRICRNEIYVGRSTWGKSETLRRLGKQGKKIYRLRDPEKVFRVDVPQARIIDDALWKAAQATLQQKAETFQRGPHGRLQGRPEGTLTSAFLLTGLSACPCGASMIMIQRSHNRGATRYYGCSLNHSRGELTSCSPSLSSDTWRTRWTRGAPRLFRPMFDAETWSASCP